jgi:hypothetical protein
VRSQRLDGGAVAGVGHDLEVGLGAEQHLQPFPHEHVIIGNDDRDRRGHGSGRQRARDDSIGHLVSRPAPPP